MSSADVFGRAEEKKALDAMSIELTAVERAAIGALRTTLRAQRDELSDAWPDIDAYLGDLRHLRRALRSRSFVLKDAARSVSGYARFLRRISGMPDGQGVFQHLSMSEAQYCLSSNMMVPLPSSSRDSDGRRIVVSTGFNTFVRYCKSCGARKMYCAIHRVLDETMHDEEVQTKGLSVIIDLGGLTYRDTVALLRDTELMDMAKLDADVVACLPLRLGRVVMLDAPWYFSVPWAICRRFLGDVADCVSFLRRENEADMKKFSEWFRTEQLLPGLGGSLEFDFMEEVVRPAVESEGGVFVNATPSFVDIEDEDEWTMVENETAASSRRVGGDPYCGHSGDGSFMEEGSGGLEALSAVALSAGVDLNDLRRVEEDIGYSAPVEERA